MAGGSLHSHMQGRFSSTWYRGRGGRLRIGLYSFLWGQDGVRESEVVKLQHEAQKKKLMAKFLHYHWLPVLPQCQATLHAQ